VDDRSLVASDDEPPYRADDEIVMGEQGRGPAIAVSYYCTGGAQRLIAVVDRCVEIEVEPALAPSFRLWHDSMFSAHGCGFSC
jgi:hypothetical protein